MARRKDEDAIMFEIELLEEEMLDLKGETREKAAKAYRRLLSSINGPVYLKRSE